MKTKVKDPHALIRWDNSFSYSDLFVSITLITLETVRLLPETTVRATL